MAFVIVLLVVLVVAVVVVIVMRRNRSTTSSVDSFRRHIDALGPEARRTTVDQVQSAAARNAGDDDAVDPPSDESATEPSSTDDRPRAVHVARDLAIDLGTANTLVYMKGRGIVLNEPSVIALNRQTGEVLATGREAWQMIGRTPGYIVAVRPLRGGAITDFEITERMIRLLLQRVGVSRFTRPKVVICVPSAITEVERRAVTDAARRAGAADANLIEQPMAAAIGADLPIDEPVGNMVIDIGGGTSETAVISLGGIVALEAVRVGSFDIDAAIQNYVRREHGIAIGERTAEEIKMAIGSADPTPQESQAEVRGRDLMTGLPKTVILTPEEIRYAIEDVVSSIIASVIRCLAKAPPELSQDFLVRGMYLVGGGGLLRGLASADRTRDEGAGADVERPARSGRARRRSRDRALRRAQGDVHGRASLTMRVDVDAAAAMSAGLDRIRREAAIPDAFPADVLAACAVAIKRTVGSDHRDRTDRRFVTLDPATSVDLDQAFDIEQSGSDLLLHYAIADVGWFVRPGDRTRRRGVRSWRHRVHARPAGDPLPDQLSEGAASLLPDVDRPAVVFVVRVGSDGASHLDEVERAVVRSRAKLAYDTVADADLPDGFVELHRRIEAAEQRRDAMRVEFPEQQIDRDDDGSYTLRFRPRADSEDHNAAMSLATNLAVADALLAARTGAVPCDARRRRPTHGAAAPLRPGVRPRVAAPASRSRSTCARCRPTTTATSAFLLADPARVGWRELRGV